MLPRVLPLLGVLLLATAGLAQGACMPLCGDCDENLQVDVLDVLLAAQIDVGLQMITPEQLLACDVQPILRDSDVDALDALVLAQLTVGLPVNLGCFPVVSAPEGYGVPTPQVHSSITVSDPSRTMPRFECPQTTVFFDVRPNPGTTELTLTVAGMSIPTDVDLYVANPGVPPGDLTPSNYPRRSQTTGTTPETIQLCCSSLASYGGVIAVAVHAFEAGGFNFQVVGGTATCSCGAPPIVAGEKLVGSIPVPGVFECPPEPCSARANQYELLTIPPTATALEICMFGMGSGATDMDLWLGWPGTCAGECCVESFHGSLRSATGGWRWGDPFRVEFVTLSGMELADYGGGPLAIGVSSFEGPAGMAYSLEVLASGQAGLPLASTAATSPVEGSLSPCRTCLSPLPFADVEDRWELNALAGQVLEVTVDAASPEGAFDPLVEVRESGQTAILASADDVLPCAFPAPLSSGMECPTIQLTLPSSGAFEILVRRSPDGTCVDAENGHYRLEVTVDGNPVLLTPMCDDC